MKLFRKSALAAAMAALCFASAAMAQTELNVWEDIQKSKGIAAAVADFEKQYDVKVNILEMPFVQHVERIRLDGPAGIGPDVFMLPSDQLGATVVQGLIAPIGDTDVSDYTDLKSSLNAFTSDGTLYGLPKVVETLVLFYNKDLLPKPFDTLAEYYSYSQERVKEQGNYGLLGKFDQIYYSYGAVAPYGGYIFKRDDKGNFNVEDLGVANDGAVEAVTYLKSWFDNGLLPAGILGENGLNAIDTLFTEKKAAAVINGPWAMEPYKAAGINYGVTALPKLPNGKDMSSFLGVKGYVVSNWAKDHDLAVKFIQFVNQPKYAKIRFETTAEIPPLKSVMNDPVIKDNEFANAVAVQSQRAEAMPSIPEMSEVWGPVDSALQLSVSGKQDVKEALQGAADQIASQIEAFRSGL